MEGKKQGLGRVDLYSGRVFVSYWRLRSYAVHVLICLCLRLCVSEWNEGLIVERRENQIFVYVVLMQAF